MIISIVFMKKILISFVLLALTPLVSFPFKDIFIRGNIGDYSIYQNGSSVTILTIHSKELPFIIFEEITLAKNIYDNIKGADLNTWVKKGARGCSSWTVMEINTKTLDITSAYCFTRHAHLCLNAEDTLITSLLSLDIKKIAKENLLRIGPRSFNKKDTRPYWIPSMFVSGKKKEPKKMEVYGGIWDKDGSPLSGRSIDLYLLNDFAFPYWIQIHGAAGGKKMVSIDSGKGLFSPVKDIPKIAPSFASSLEIWNNEISKFSFLVNGDRSFSNFSLHLLEVAKSNAALIPIETTFLNIASGVRKFSIERTILSAKLTAGQKYRLYLTYEDGDKVKSIISKDLIHWK